MEFMAMGVPVVTGNTRIDQYYFNENVAQFFEAGNVEDLAATIFDLMQSPVKRQGLRERASEFILSNSWDVRKHEYLQLVDSLAGQKASPEVASDRPGTIDVHGGR
jgi:glycosyltransferase involved in cell wall biosynthesis